MTEQRCESCHHWRLLPGQVATGECLECATAGFSTARDFGCVKWQACGSRGPYKLTVDVSELEAAFAVLNRLSDRTPALVRDNEWRARVREAQAEDDGGVGALVCVTVYSNEWPEDQYRQSLTVRLTPGPSLKEALAEAMLAAEEAGKVR